MKAQQGLNKPRPAGTSFDSLEEWVKEFKSIGWGQEMYEQTLRKKVKDQLQLEEGEVVVFAGSSGGWLLWVQSADTTEAAVAYGVAGTNRRLTIWTSQRPDLRPSRFREFRYRDMKEVVELTELRIGEHVRKFAGLIGITFREKDEALGILLGTDASACLLGYLKAASSAPITVEGDRSLNAGGMADYQGERSNMAQKSLLSMLDDLASKVRLLEREKMEAAATIQALEREKEEAITRTQALEGEVAEAVAKAQALEREKGEAVAKAQALEREIVEAVLRTQSFERENSELRSLISLASAKVDEILQLETNGEISQPQAVNVPVASKGLEELGTNSSSQPEQRKWRFPRVFEPPAAPAQ